MKTPVAQREIAHRNRKAAARKRAACVGQPALGGLRLAASSLRTFNELHCLPVHDG